MASYSDTDGHSRVGDVVEIVTPAGVTRRIDTLDHGWRQRQAIADSYINVIKPEPSSYLYIAIGISAVALGIAIFSRR